MYKFSEDKESLLQTLKRFDGDVTIEEVTDDEEFKNESSNHTFLLHVLLEALCGTVERDSEKSLQLFNGVHRFLSNSNVLDENIALDNLMLTRRKMAFKLLNIVTEIHKTIVPNPAQDLQYLDFTKTPEFEKYQDKYKQTFDEIKVIAEGGFGTVFMARHKFDGLIYAVKKIIFKLKSDSEYSRVIREVKSISTLNHLNVVSYNNAWIEEKPSQSELSSETSSSNEESEWGSQNNSLKSQKKVSRSNVIRFGTASSISHSSHRSSKVSEDVIFSKLEDSSSGQVVFNNKLQNKFFESSHLSEMSEYSSINSEIDSFQVKNSNVSYRTSRLREKSSLMPSFKNLSFMYPKVMLCIQMEYCDCDLRLWLDQRAKGDALPFHIDEVNIFKDILNGVAHIHSKSIIHRDLKPQNIFYSTKDNVMKIGDFGLATLGNTSPSKQKDLSTQHSSDLGTLPYAAPEQRNGHNYNSKVDIYSLGIILIELLLQFQTKMEFCKTIDDISKGAIPDELLEKWPNYVFLVENLIKKNPNTRMSAKDILCLPLIQGNNNYEDMKGKLLEKDKLIEKLLQKINEQTALITHLRKQIELSQKSAS